MKHFGEMVANRRSKNAAALSAFGGSCGLVGSAHYRTIREGGKRTIFTIGYEKRSGDELISLLLDADVDILVDVREKAMSRKPDFRGSALQARCEEAGIQYEPIPGLGSTEDQRSALRESRDIETFQRRFRKYAKRHCIESLDQLASIAKKKSVALMCYERCHEDCHRTGVAELVADAINASIIAIT